MNGDIFKLIEEMPLNAVKLHDALAKMNTVDIADIFEELNKEKTIQVFRLLPKSIAADVFSYIVPEKQKIIVDALTDDEVGRIADELFVDDAVDLIEEMPANVVSRILQNVGDEKRKLINHILQYPEDSAGSIMTTEYVDLREDSTVREAFDYIRKTGINKETVYTCYVMRRDRILTGIISVKTLLLARPQDRIGDIMETNLVYAHTTDDQEIITDLFKKYDLLSLPVVDAEKRLVGIVTIDDAIDIIEEETTEDIEKMAAISPSDKPYFKTSVVQLYKARIPWLIFLVISATFTGMIIRSFEDALKIVPSLMMFVPVLMGTGGNTGSQSSVTVIRGLSLNEINFSDIFRVMWKETRIAFLCAVTIGAALFLKVLAVDRLESNIAFVVSATAFTVIIVAKFVGCSLPLLAKKIGLDPTVMASPFISTIVDTIAMIAYFLIATRVLPGI